MQIEGSSFIDNSIVDLASSNEFTDIDINLTDLVNLINLTLKAISLVTEDRLRTKNLSLIKLVIMRSWFWWIFTSLKIKLTYNQVLINVSIDIKLQFNFSINSMSINHIVILLVVFCLMIILSWLSDSI